MAARVEAARALELADRAQFRPTLRFATAPAETPDSRSAYLQSGIEAAWPLGLFGRAAGATDASAADTRLAQTAAELLRTKIVADTVRSYIERRTASLAASDLDAQIATQAERTELTRDRVRLRLSGPRDLDAEEAHLGELKLRRLALDRTIAEERERLGLLIASADAYPLAAATSDPVSIATPRLQSVPADLLRSRPDVRHAEQEALKAAADLHIAKADLYPQLTLSGSLTLSLPVAGTARGSANALATVAPSIDIPLFDWGRRRAIVTATDHLLEAALIAYRDSILRGVHEVEVAFGSLESLNQDAELRRQAWRRAERIDANTASAVHLGRISRLDALARTLDRLEAHASLGDAERSRALAFVSLCEALGGSYPRTPT